MSAESDARALANLREWRASRDPRWPSDAPVKIYIDDVDLLLRIADERDELARKLAEMPDDRPKPRCGEPCRHGGSCSLEEGHSEGQHESRDSGGTLLCSWPTEAYLKTECPGCHHSPHPVGQLCWVSTCGCRVGVVL